MMFKIIFSLLFVLTIIFSFSIPQVYDSLENVELYGESAVILLEIKFGLDEYQSLFTKTITHTQIEGISLLFYGDKITLSEPELKVYGNNFRILSLPEGILMYGHKNSDIGNYKVNVYISTDKGLEKFTTYANITLPKEEIPESVEKKSQYIPELLIASSHDFRTYWEDTFNIDVQSYDGKINPNATGFERKLDNANVTVIPSYKDTYITLSGVTTHVNWDGEYYFQKNTSMPGEYIVDVIVVLLT